MKHNVTTKSWQKRSLNSLLWKAEAAKKIDDNYRILDRLRSTKAAVPTKTKLERDFQ